MKRFYGRWTPLTSFDQYRYSLRHGKELDQSSKLGDAMVLVPFSLDYVRQLQRDRITVFDYADTLIPLVRQAGFGLVIVEGQGVKNIIAVGRKSDLVGKARAWKQPY